MTEPVPPAEQPDPAVEQDDTVRHLSDQEARTADTLIRPDTSSYASSDFSARREMIQVGYEATQRALPELRRRLDAPVRRARG